MVEIHNYMEEVVKDVWEKFFLEKEDLCRCERCLSDIMAFALNRLPPKYVVTQKGRVYVKLDELKLQKKVDVIRSITEAIKVVKENPRH
ncbi:MAG: competence protein ComFB [Candidatus Omnitrophica bacterium 4484_70.1]|nr:MAG: competence protein ComFB [Candidatus Omnitrophica bacterium 4484_70.1]